MLLQIPGPTFLIYFIGLSAICIFLGRLWVYADGSTQYPLPELTRFDPLAITALRGNSALTVKTAVFSLWNRKLIEIKIRKHWWKKDEIEISVAQSSQKTLSPIEKEVYKFLRSRSPEPSNLFKDSDLREQIKRYLDPIYRELEQLHLVRSASDRSRAWIATLSMTLIIGAVGGTKLYLGITRGRPTGFLIALIIVSLIALYSVLKPQTVFTILGHRYLKTLEKHFAWVKASVKAGVTPEGIDPALPIAIFGVGILAGTSLYTPFSDAFTSKQSGWGAWSGGCGGGCGGGGCGGGGCGGCGG